MKASLMYRAETRVHTVDTHVMVASTAGRPLLLVPIVSVEVGCLLLQEMLGVPEAKGLVLAISAHYALVEDVVELIEGCQLPLLLA